MHLKINRYYMFMFEIKVFYHKKGFVKELRIMVGGNKNTAHNMKETIEPTLEVKMQNPSNQGDRLRS